jgi:predicted ester cyclase
LTVQRPIPQGGWASRAKQTVAVTSVLERLLPLWTQPVDARPDPVAAFGEVYADPVLVNGTELALTGLVDRARALQRAFDGLSMQILDIVEAPGRVVVAFMMRGQHTGPFVSPVGTIAPTHRDIEVRTIDVLTLTAGVISDIWVVSDELGLLRQLTEIKLA